ncbi:MAG: hypothetical protein D6728_07485 [Cyanobacteria bacterium J055]|nr:MAG: hypothetical protein D6728_07485 [Cyanobacteria bacterium J055]
MNVLHSEDGKFNFLISDLPKRYRANCKQGCFLDSGIATKAAGNLSKIQSLGGDKGDFVEAVVVGTQHRILTFEPHYIQEEFIEIWCFPVAGKMAISPTASQLSTFLLHRQRMDGFRSIGNELSEVAFLEWLQTGKEEDPVTFAESAVRKAFESNIFRFEFVPKTSSKYGNYFAVSTSTRQPKSDLEKAALKLIDEARFFCIDPAIDQNHQNCLKDIELQQKQLTDR